MPKTKVTVRIEAISIRCEGSPELVRHVMAQSLGLLSQLLAPEPEREVEVDLRTLPVAKQGRPKRITVTRGEVRPL